MAATDGRPFDLAAWPHNTMGFHPRIDDGARPTCASPPAFPNDSASLDEMHSVVSVLLDPLWVPVGYEVQSDAMFEEGLQAREHQREPLRRVGDVPKQVGL